MMFYFSPCAPRKRSYDFAGCTWSVRGVIEPIWPWFSKTIFFLKRSRGKGDTATASCTKQIRPVKRKLPRTLVSLMANPIPFNQFSFFSDCRASLSYLLFTVCVHRVSVCSKNLQFLLLSKVFSRSLSIQWWGWRG